MTAPRRRWSAFSLQTLFVVVALLATPLGWVAYSLNWIRQRHEFREHHVALEFPTVLRGPSFFEMEECQPEAPGCLWIFGERGQPAFMLKDAGQTEWAKGRPKINFGVS